MKRAIFWILLILAGFVAWIRPGHAGPLGPQAAVEYAKQTQTGHHLGSDEMQFWRGMLAGVLYGSALWIVALTLLWRVCG